MPFGESFVEQQANTGFNNPYKFTGHELDKQTGLYYAKARFYSPKRSIFLSVDPLAEMLPSWSPYHYAFLNPVKFNDPTGMIGENTGGGEGSSASNPVVLPEIVIRPKRGVSYYGNRIAGMMNDGKSDAQIKSHFSHLAGTNNGDRFNEAFANRSFYYNYYHGGMSNAQSASALLENTDANDAFILLSSLFNNPLKFDSSADGGISKADGVDQSFALGGIFVAGVSGSALKQVTKLDNLVTASWGTFKKSLDGYSIHKKGGIFQVNTKNAPFGLEKGDFYYLDKSRHGGEHIEWFDKMGKSKGVLNPDGTINQIKSKAAEGRTLKIKNL